MMLDPPRRRLQYLLVAAMLTLPLSGCPPSNLFQGSLFIINSTGGVLRSPWRQLLADVLGRPLGLLPASVAPAASARGAALLAGLAQGTYDSVQETIFIAPKIWETILPQDGRYEAAYARYRKLYPRLREP